MVRTIVVSGIPGSGKTTLGREVAARLDVPFYDKDDFLEVRFRSGDTVSSAERRVMSRAADTDLITAVEADAKCVATSFWRRPEVSTESGTPTDWLAVLDDVVEIYCECPPRVAADRFVTRDRHPGHGDASKTREEVEAAFVSLAELGPLGVGRVVEVATDANVDYAGLLALLQ